MLVLYFQTVCVEVHAVNSPFINTGGFLYVFLRRGVNVAGVRIIKQCET